MPDVTGGAPGTTTQAEIPQEAIDRAADVLLDNGYENLFQTSQDVAAAMLAAAGPVIAAGAAAEERRRLRALVPYNVNCCDGFPAAVADILGEHGDDPPLDETTCSHGPHLRGSAPGFCDGCREGDT